VVDWQTKWGTQMKLLIIGLLFILATLAANGADAPKSSVFIKAACDGKISAAVVTSLRAEIDASPKYHLVPNLSDEGRMGEVLTIAMACSDRTDVASVATTYGKAKCFPGSYCHQAVDGSSLKSALCDSNAAAECGRALFKTFDDYTDHLTSPGAPQLQLH
jgi:hypothetical protein